jgi:UDPglucose--hexose-1-phosphate uridylyltransferase
VAWEDVSRRKESAVEEIELSRERLEAEILDPRRGFERVRLPVEIRRDPLTGRTCRLLPPGSLPPPVRVDVAALSELSRPGCPFCPERIEEATPRLPPEVSREGRLRHGEAVLFPNLLPYAKWSSVSVYSPRRHAIALRELDAAALADNLHVQVAFLAAVAAHDPSSTWCSINANQAPPSGSSIFHPHLQGSANPRPTTAQRVYASVEPARYRAYLERERGGERLLGSTGTIDWIAAFAPGGQAEVIALHHAGVPLARLTETATAELAAGVARVLGLYAELGFGSFNMAVYGAPPRRAELPQVIRLVARSRIGPLERADVMWSELLHGETVVDVAPETVAELGREHF